MTKRSTGELESRGERGGHLGGRSGPEDRNSVGRILQPGAPEDACEAGRVWGRWAGRGLRGAGLCSQAPGGPQWAEPEHGRLWPPRGFFAGGAAGSALRSTDGVPQPQADWPSAICPLEWASFH